MLIFLLTVSAHQNPYQEVERIADFLGQNLSKALIDEIVQKTTFVAMRDNPMANYSSVPDTIFDRRASVFMRKGERRERVRWRFSQEGEIVFWTSFSSVSTGEVGDWQNHFSSEQNAIFEEHYRRIMADDPIPFRFLIWSNHLSPGDYLTEFILSDW